jgi:hypothetical protein
MATRYQRDLVMARLAYPDEVGQWLQARRKFARAYRSRPRVIDVVRVAVTVSLAERRLRESLQQDDRFNQSSVFARLDRVRCLTIRLQQRKRRAKQPPPASHEGQRHREVEFIFPSK